MRKLLLLLFFVSGFATYMFRKPALEYLGCWALSKNGIEGCTISLQSLNWKNIFASNLTLRTELGRREIGLDARDVALEWDLSVLRNPVLDLLSIEELSLVLGESRGASTEQSSKTALGPISELIPIRNIEIHRATVDVSSVIDRDEKIAFSLAFSHASNGARLKVETDDGVSLEVIEEGNVQNYSLHAPELADLLPLTTFLPITSRVSEHLVIDNGKAVINVSQSFANEGEFSKASVTLSNVAGQFMGSAFRDFTLVLKSAGEESKFNKIDISANLKRLEYGIVIENLKFAGVLSLTGTFKPKKLAIRTASVSMFEGDIRVSPAEYNFDRDIQTNVVLKNVSLEELLALYPKDGISVTGSINGNLPVRWNKGTVTVTDGKISTNRPGAISINAETFGSPENKQLAFVARILENFQYEKLSSRVTLKEDGALLLDLSIVGKNPDVRSGAPINLNVTIEENLFALLKSIQATRKLIGSQ